MSARNRSYNDDVIISAALHTIIEALNQFQQPHTVGHGIRDNLELVQREHLVLFKRIPTTGFELILATPLPNVYIEQTEARIRLLHKRTHTELDCDLLLYELIRRFVGGSLSFEGLEARVTDIENFLARLRGNVIQNNERDAYILVGKDIAFSTDHGKIIVRPA